VITEVGNLGDLTIAASGTVRYVPDKYFDVNGIATLVHHRGMTTLPGSAPDLDSGQPVLFLHDAGVNGNTFADVMDLLTVDHSPVSLDLPGHGRSASLDSLPTVEAMASHIESLMAPWGLHSLTVVGDGLGAAIGVELAANGSLPVASLVCVGSVGPFISLTSEIDELTQITTGKARRQFDTTGYAPEPDEKMMRKAFSHWVTTDPRATLGARKAQAEWNSQVDLSKVACTTIVAIGTHTEEASKANSLSFAEQLELSQIVMIEGAGRHSAQEVPSDFCAVIRDSITESSTAS
tara:strand:- start:19309 stop:20187 length:879 start_codon:yes stop_codon:yes gene_type:complete